MTMISFIIRFHNEEKYIGECLEAIARQEGDFKKQIIFVNDSSDDKSVDIVNEFISAHSNIKCELIDLAEKFTFSSAINKALPSVEGEFTVILSAHATFATNEWLKYEVENFADTKVAIVYGRLLVRKSANTLSLMTSLPVSVPYKIIKSADFFSRSDDKFNAFAYINLNTCNMIRTDLLKEFRFRELPSVEDMDLGKRLLEKGYKIVYEPRATVWHSHNDSTDKIVNRWINAAVGMRLVFKGKVPGKLSLLKSTLPSYVIFMLKVSNRERNPIFKINYSFRAMSGAFKIINSVFGHYDSIKIWESKFHNDIY